MSRQMLFSPHLEILPDPQRELWRELNATPDYFTLYGGTALALRLGHRQSVDFDFFGDRPIDPQALMSEIPYLENAKVLDVRANSLNVSVERGGPIKLSFFGVPNLGKISPPNIAEGTNIKVASLIDIAGTKAAVVQQRAEAKDYLDFDALMTKGDISLSMALSAGKEIYKNQFNPQVTLKALSYFGEKELSALPDDLKKRLLAAVKSVDLERLPSLERLRDLDLGRGFDR